MARNQHSYAKRQRELAKKQKAEEKRARRQQKSGKGADDDEPDQPESSDLDQTSEATATSENVSP